MSAETTSGGQGGGPRLSGHACDNCEGVGIDTCAYNPHRREDAAAIDAAREAPTDDAALVEEVARAVDAAADCYDVRCPSCDEPAYVACNGNSDGHVGRWALAGALTVIPVVTRAVAGRARREALEEAADALSQHEMPMQASGREAVAAIVSWLRHLATRPAPATDDTEGQ